MSNTDVDITDNSEVIEENLYNLLKSFDMIKDSAF